MSALKLRLGILFLVLFGMGLFFSISGTIDNSKAANAELDFNYMSENEFEEGMYVKGRVYEIYDEFAYEESYQETYGVKHSEKVSSHYYVVPMAGTFESETPMYIAVEISHVKTAEEAQKLMEQTWDYYDYDKEPEVWNEFDIVGEVTPLEGELLDYFYEWFMYGDEGATRADYEPYICPWLITYHSVGGHSSSVTFGLIIAAVGAIGLAVMITLTVKSRGVNRTPAASSAAQYTGGYTYDSTDTTAQQENTVEQTRTDNENTMM